jgi:hypothetical protein
VLAHPRSNFTEQKIVGMTASSRTENAGETQQEQTLYGHQETSRQAFFFSQSIEYFAV